jgi:hypothetical protein
VVLSDIAQYIELLSRRIPGRTWIGGAGAFDAVVIAGVIAVVLAEVVGESRERLQGGTAKREERGPETSRLTGMLGGDEEGSPGGGSQGSGSPDSGRGGDDL